LGHLAFKLKLDLNYTLLLVVNPKLTTTEFDVKKLDITLS